MKMKREAPLGIYESFDEAETGMSEKGQEIYFITPDCRTYSRMYLSDGACWVALGADTINALKDLQDHIEMLGNGQMETSFLQISKHAQELGDCFQRLCAQLKIDPIAAKKRR